MDELLLILSGTWLALEPRALLEVMVECGGGGERNGLRKVHRVRSSFVIPTQFSILGTGQSSHTNIWGNAETRLKKIHMWVPFLRASANAIRTVPEV